MKGLSKEECQCDYVKSIVEKHQGNIMDSLPQTMKERIINMTDSAKEKILETEYGVLRLHGTLKKLGWLRDWTITIPPGIRLEGPSEDYPGFGRIMLDIENYISIKGPNIKKIGIDKDTIVNNPITREVKINGFNRTRYEIENALIKLGYAERNEHGIFWKTNAHQLKSDEKAIFHIHVASGCMSGWSSESISLIRKMYDVPAIANSVTLTEPPLKITPISHSPSVPPYKPNGTSSSTVASNMHEKAERITKNMQTMLSEINEISKRQLEDADRVAAMAQELSDMTAEVDMLFLSMKIHQEEVEKQVLKAPGRIELPPKPVEKVDVYSTVNVIREPGNKHNSPWEKPIVRTFRITDVSARKAGAPGQFYSGIDEDGKAVSLLGFDELTMLNKGESITVNSIEKISKNGQHIYYAIWPLDESDGQEY